MRFGSDYAGLRLMRRCRQMGTYVGLYHGAEAGIDPDPQNPYVTVCEEHHTIASHPTRRLAERHLSYPAEWCDACRSVLEERR